MSTNERIILHKKATELLKEINDVENGKHFFSNIDTEHCNGLKKKLQKKYHVLINKITKK